MLGQQIFSKYFYDKLIILKLWSRIIQLIRQAHPERKYLCLSNRISFLWLKKKFYVFLIILQAVFDKDISYFLQ